MTTAVPAVVRRWRLVVVAVAAVVAAGATALGSVAANAATGSQVPWWPSWLPSMEANAVGWLVASVLMVASSAVSVWWVQSWYERRRVPVGQRVDVANADGHVDATTVRADQAAFEVARQRYLSRIRDRYRRVELEILTPLTDQGKHPAMLLEEVFVPQHVRADPPPVEVPREVWQRLAKAAQDDAFHLPERVDRDKLEAALRAYHDRPARPVLEVLAEPAGRKVVLLGDPGAGKSTLARYLMLALAGRDVDSAGDRDSQGHDHRQYGVADLSVVSDPAGAVPARLAGVLPLLVELRLYADPEWRSGRSATFLDLIDHLHTTQDVGLPRSVLEPFLDGGGAALVIFDGLDEVFDPRLRAEITAEIEGFAARYARTQVVVTSRMIGYRRETLDAAGFGHWMLQDLDADQIRAFTTGWYSKACPDDSAQAGRLRDRLLAAVDASTAVAELAGNPMLLTILAIIGRRQELPRNRRSVYEHAVTVLVEHWDVNKHLHDERITIDYLDAQDKLELLHLVARHMQDAPAGLAGNHIPGPDLTDRFRAYLQDRFALPADEAIPAARAMLAQFRERNFILARFGSEVYGFVHRAFLEYLAADDLTRRLADLDLSQEDLLAIYRQHWPDPAWTEVLLLLTGMIPDRLAAQAIAGLLEADPHWRLRPSPPRHLLLALQATTEVRKAAALAPHAPALTHALTALLTEIATRENRRDQTLRNAVQRLAPHLVTVFVPTWAAASIYQDWYRRSAHQLAGRPPYTAARVAAMLRNSLVNPDVATLLHDATDPHWPTREAAVQAIAAGFADDAATLPLLRERATTDDYWAVRQAAVRAIAAGFADDAATLPLLRELATTDDDWAVRQAAVRAIAAGFADDAATLPLLRERATTDDDEFVRQAAVRAIAAGFADDAATLPLLRERATTDDDEDVRRVAVQAIAARFADDAATLPLLRELATTDDDEDVRRVAVQAIAARFADDAATLPLLRELATTDDDWAVRQAAVQAIAARFADDPATLSWLREQASTDNDNDNDSGVRRVAVRAIAAGFADDPATLPLLRERATTDDDEFVRQAAVQAIAARFADDPATLPWLRELATTHNHSGVWQVAVQAIAARFADDPATLPWLRELAATDNHRDVRRVAVQAIAARFPDDAATLPWLRELAATDNDAAVRRVAVQAIAARFPDDAATLPLLQQLATTDNHSGVRQVAVQAIAAGFADDPATLPWLRELAATDNHRDVRRVAVQAIAARFADDPATLPLLRQLATTDNHSGVRQAAVRVIAARFADDAATLPLLRELATTDDDEAVRRVAVQAIAAGFADDAATLPLLREATTDDDEAVRRAAVQAIAAHFPDDAATLPLLRQLATTDDDEDMRRAAVQAIAAHFPDDAATLPLLRQLATTDDDEDMRQAAVQAIAAHFPDDAATLPLLREQATTDKDEDVRRLAVQAIAARFPDDAATLPLLRELATTDNHSGVRQAAVRAIKRIEMRRSR
ncbi:HEAT repeat domain-containing protein [Dactylosporangium sp. AC04546]|uniref:HEAT repeat domain-containing protein n=1 Tax=Dactylosporangium sp. AC04546 TaxID=2862460 RepID=UPI002E7B68CE|nr:HEAT repeat domain-containing protein [Dactylosporangium sp. AC04546]WVK84643.1 HEAT repeat domain-containing protein [Dactylosporangium sp. AC04546]